jgi:hypothetical protein
MHRPLRYLISRLDAHPSDEVMAKLLCGELSWRENLIAKQHMIKCWHCRVRREDLEGRRAEQMIRLYRDAIDNDELSLDWQPREELQRRLQMEIEHAAPRRRWAIRLPHLAWPNALSFSPVLAGGAVLGLAGAVSFAFFWQQRLPNITSNALLVRAERWDSAEGPALSGVVFQQVTITTPHQTMKLSIYRDIQGKRTLKQVKLNAGEDQLKTRLSQAGLDWDEPISAASYQGWHDHQHVREDKVARAGGHLLVLTTTVPDGSVVEQTLTVRDSDFHPIKRTIAFRDSGTVEIAELDFKILPWSGVDENLFESLPNAENAVPTAMAHVLPLPRMPETLSEGQLEESELGARLILNQLHADTGQQIEIVRTPQGVELKGLVETDDLKRALQEQLHALPHLTASIQSVADVRNAPAARDEVIDDTKAASAPYQPSPLEAYLVANGRSVRDINVLSRQLFESALTISRESKAIGDLQTRFMSAEQKSLMASATLSDLLYSHRERLQTALKRERELLGEAQGAPLQNDEVNPSRPPLIEAAFRNLAFCKELTQSSNPPMRNADKILVDMAGSIGDLRSDIGDSYAKASSTAPSNGGK